MEAVVVDPGSKLLKAGYAIPDQEPSMTIPTKMKCVPEDGQPIDSSAYDDVTVDPVIRGFIKDWDAMEDLLRYVLYTGLEWEEGNEGQILFTDPLATPKVVREKLIQLMFETFNVSGFYASEQAVLSLYAVGRISGCTVDVGHGKIDIAPVYEGAVQHIAAKRFEIGGIDLTQLLAQQFQQSHSLNIDISEVEKLKELYACCAEDHFAYEEKQKTCLPEKHTLPDGQELIIGKERYTVGEALFQPSILGLEEHGIVEQLVRCVTSVPYESQRMLLENTVLCGGTTSMAGFEDRFQKEAGMCSSAFRPLLVKVHSPELIFLIVKDCLFFFPAKDREGVAVSLRDPLWESNSISNRCFTPMPLSYCSVGVLICSPSFMLVCSQSFAFLSWLIWLAPHEMAKISSCRFFSAAS